MLAAAAMGATALQKGLGAVHSISHPVGAVYDTHHGLTNAVVLPYVLKFHRAAVADKMAHLARLLDLPKPGFDGVMGWLLDIRRRLGIPHSFPATDVPEQPAHANGRMADADPIPPGPPV